MSKVELKNVEGKKVKDLELADSVFGIEPNVSAMHQVVRAQRAWMRQGTHSTKSRGLVSGGGRKPWRQKGTGRARQGSIRSPQWRGGGVVFGPTPRDYSFRVNNKVVKLAMRSALSAKLAENELVVLDEIPFEKPSTKQAANYLKNLGVEGRVTIVVSDEDFNSHLSFRNIPTACVISVAEANTYDLIDNATLIMTEAVANRLEEVLA